MRDKYLVAIPVFNEEAHVSPVIEAVTRHTDHLLVIDDGSTDGTAGLLARFEGLRVLRHDQNRGYGQSLIDAFAYAAGEGFEWLITMDCDEQHEPDSIPGFVTAAECGNADVISGSRYLMASTKDDRPPADRRSINRKITYMVNSRLDLGITDAFCGFKAYRVSALHWMRLTERGYAMPMQFWVQAARLRLRVRELPVRLVYNDPNRHFGGQLDNPTVRFRHYVDVFERELRAFRAPDASGPIHPPGPCLRPTAADPDTPRSKCASS